MATKTTIPFAWRHSSEDVYRLVNAKVLPFKKLDNGNHHDYLGSRHCLVVLSQVLPKKDAIRALAIHFAELHTQVCHHEHDCCGCHHAYVVVTHRRGRTYSLVTRHFRNY